MLSKNDPNIIEMPPFPPQTEEQFEHFDFGYDEAQIRSLGADDLINHSGNFYPYYYLNLLSLLGGNRPVDQIRDMAVESTRATLLCVGEYLKFLADLPELARLRDSGQSVDMHRSLIRLGGWDLEMIQSLLDRGRGLIFCSHHLGPFMSLPQELALMGYKVSLMIDDITFRDSYPRLEFIKRQLQRERAVTVKDKSAVVAPENIHNLNILNAQEKESFVALIKALERGECIFVYVDGNTGWDGVWGVSSKSAFDFLGFPIATKNGIPRLAAATGAPILPLVTITNGNGGGEIVYGGAILPPLRMAAEDKDQFVLQSIKAIYKLLEDHALRYIDQWSSSCFLHRWRTASPAGRAVAPARIEVEEIDRHLNDGNCFKINESRIAGLTVKDNKTLVDVKTLKIYKAPEEAANLFSHLLRKEGLNSADLSAMTGGFEGRQKIVTLLAYLKKLDVIVAV